MSDPLDAFTSAPASVDPLDAFTTGDPAKAAAAAQPDAPLVARIGSAINSAPGYLGRQLGLTARDALVGPATAAQIITEPIRYATDRILGTTGQTLPLGALAGKAADAIGLPSPQTAAERVANEGATLGFGAMTPGGIGEAATRLGVAAAPATSRVGQMLNALTANPTQQVASAAGAGVTGQASKEAGGSPLVQTGAAILGGVAGGVAPGLGGALWDTAKRLVTPGASAQAVEQAYQTAVQQSGINLGAMGAAARLQLRRDFNNAMNTGGQIDQDSLARLAALRAAGVTPTQGMVSLDPVQITREANLAKIGANTGNPALGGLAQLQANNDRALIGSMNAAGGNAGVSPLTAGSAVKSAIIGRDAANGAAEQAAWDAAKAHPGYTAPIVPDGLHAINAALGDSGMMPFMAPGISKYMEAFQNGSQPFTAQAYRNLRSMLSGELSKGGNEAAAASTAIRALDSTPITPIKAGAHLDFGGDAVASPGMASAMRASDGQAQEAIDLVNKARQLTAQKYAYQSSSPLVKTALSDARTSDPENLAKSFVLGGTFNDAQAVHDAVGPQGVAGVRDALSTYLKSKMVSGATSDDTAKVSAKGLSDALASIGDQKLGLFYSPEELAQLKNIARASTLTKFQPTGSAVNNSNSGALAVGKALDFLDSKVLRFLPGADYTPGLITAPIRNATQSIAGRGVQNVTPGLLQPQPVVGAGRGLLLPATTGGALFTSGLLGSN